MTTIGMLLFDDLEELDLVAQRADPRVALREGAPGLDEIEGGLAQHRLELVLARALQASQHVPPLAPEIDLLEDVHDLLTRAIADDPPATLQDGGVIRAGWSSELDDIREVRDGARDFIASLQVRKEGFRV